MTSDKKFEDGFQAVEATPTAEDGAKPAGVDASATTPGREAIGEADEIAKLRAEAADLKDRLLRAHAEMENVRKRLEREKADQAKFAITKFARDVVEVGDNVQRALEAVPQQSLEQDEAFKGFVEGVTMIERELLAILARHGVTRLDPKGQPFNPHHHQAVVEVPSDEVAAGLVAQVFQSGYMIEERVLRPAMVAVSKGATKPQSPASEVAGASVTQGDATTSENGGGAA